MTYPGGNTVSAAVTPRGETAANATDQLAGAAYQAASGTRTTAYSYDAAGNRLRDEENGVARDHTTIPLPGMPSWQWDSSASG